MSNGLVKAERPWVMVPSSLDEAVKFAAMIADSDLAPPNFKGKPANVIVAMQMGAEVGLSPMQAIQNIAVVNGRPSLWGDALLAVCQVHPEFEWIKEGFDITGSAVCTVKRKGYPEHTQTFTVKDMVQAGYDKKSGPWQTSRNRMMQLRARAFALRDNFSDALKGLSSAEEAADIAEPVIVTVIEPSQSPTAKLKEKLKASEPEPAPPAIEPPIEVEPIPQEEPEPSVADMVKAEFEPEYISQDQAKLLNGMIKDAKLDFKDFLKHFNIKRYGELPLEMYDAATEWVRGF